MCLAGSGRVSQIDRQTRLCAQVSKYLFCPRSVVCGGHSSIGFAGPCAPSV
jgi:hypothetical protein